MSVRALNVDRGRPATSPGVQNVHPLESRTPLIEVHEATLQYPIGPYVRGSLKAGALRLLGFRGEAVPPPEYVEAIKSLDLTASYGERIGVIGQNGSGKSTLLRLLAGVYPLKRGSIQVRGTVGTLLDIGLGFEPESTGRENIYYRGMSMGYSRKELRAVEDEIIEFADLGQFIDLPMRTYSAGMYVRLGFAISTQFSPDILLIDEVFGAGDAAFAARAMDRMLSIVRSAGVMILATHDLHLVREICSRVIWFNHGVAVADGDPGSVIQQYQQFTAAADAT